MRYGPEIGAKEKPEIHWVAAAVLLHLLITLPFAYSLNVWSDEGSTLFTTGQGIGFAIETAVKNEKQAPLYFIILGAWRQIDDSIFFARLFSVLAGVASIVSFWYLSRILFSSPHARILTLLFALHPFLIWSSLEIRVYPLLIVGSIIQLILFYRGYFQANDGTLQQSDSNLSRPILKASYALLGVVGLYLHYYFGFFLIGGLLALIVTGRWKSAVAYAVLLLMAGTFFVPHAFVLIEQIGLRATIPTDEKAVLVAARTIWGHFLAFVFPLELFPTGGPSSLSISRLWLARATVLASIVILAARRFRGLDANLYVIGCFVLGVAVSLILANLLVGPELLALRHASVYFVPVFLFAALAAHTILPQRLIMIPVIVFTGFAIYSNFTLLAPGAKRGDWIRVANYITKNERPKQPIVVFDAFDVLAFTAHYGGKNEIIPKTGHFDSFIEDTPGTERAYENQIQSIVSEVPENAAEIWLLTHEKCKYGDNCLPLERFVSANYEVIEDHQFYLERVRLLRRRATIAPEN